MRYAWVAAAFVGMLLVGILVRLALGGRGAEQGGAAPSSRTVTVERTIRAHSSTPKSTPPPPVGDTHSVGSLDEARSAFERAVEGYGNPNLKVGEVLEFSNNYYAEVKEKNTGIGAMELLINRPGYRVYQGPGPNMMWNTKYGMMSRGGYGHMMRPGRGMMGPKGGGMMGGSSASASAGNARSNTTDKMDVSPDRARKIADPTSLGSHRAPKQSSQRGSTATTP
jgi:hypothetical protein